MGRTLKVLADLVENKAHRATVVEVADLSPGLVRLVLACDDFRTATTDPCDVTAFRVSARDFRHYTPARLDHAAGELTIIVQRHGQGPGEALVLGWVPGDDVKVCQWASTRAYHWEDGPAPVVVVGDGTVVSLAMAFRERCEAVGRDLVAVLEVGEDDVAAARDLVPGAVVLAASGEPGAATDAWLATRPTELSALPDPTFYLSGHGQSVQRQRTALVDLFGVDRKRVRTQPYWATGKAGL